MPGRVSTSGRHWSINTNAMPLIVDCYNLLHHDMPASLAGLEESRLCRLLAASRFRGQPIAVVCDGVVKPGGLRRSPVEGVKLIYSGREHSADDVIISMIDRDTAPRRLTVVSNDREIQKAAGRRRAKVLACAALIAHLRQVAEIAETARSAGESDQARLCETDVIDWARQFEVDPDQRIDFHGDS